MLVALAAGCTRAAPGSDAGHGSDVGPRDTGIDAVSVSCTRDADCDDAIPCTFDSCVVGNVCDHTPLDAMCGAGERCSATSGCTSGCNTHADCDDHVFCNGTEQCVDHRCYHDMDRNCDDGLSCTIDTCDEATDACAYETTCDSGVSFRDSGPTCTPFSAPDDFAGTFLLAPSQNQGCGITMYTVSTITTTTTGTSVSVSGLRVDGSSVTMSGTSTGNAFTATYADGCGTYTLTGSFDACRESFAGRWTATFAGGCDLCANMDAAITGLRR